MSSMASQRQITAFFHETKTNSSNNNNKNDINDIDNSKKPKQSTPLGSPSKAYMAHREATIRRNREFLQSLGIGDSIVMAPPKKPSSSRVVAKRSTPTEPTRRMPTRVAKRVAGAPTTAISENNTNNDDAEKRDAALQESDAAPRKDVDDATSLVNIRDIPMLPIIPAMAFDSSAHLRGFGANAAGVFLAQGRVYGVDFGVVDDRLVVAMAGYQGLCGVALVAPKGSSSTLETKLTDPDAVNSDDDDDDDSDDDSDNGDARVFHEWRASTGWIGSVQFVSTDGKLLTASNDGMVKLFDVTTVTGANQPKLLTSASNFHKRGIFQAHCSRGNLFTASKDKSVAFGTLTGTELALVRRYSNIFDCAMTTVRARTDNASVFAAGGDNKRGIAVCDVRVDSDAPSLTMAHAGRLNSVVWHNDLLLSTTNSRTLKLFDVRRADNALFDFIVHRGTSILRPTFCNGGRNVVCGSDEFELSTFCTQTGCLVNRNALVGCNTVQCGALDDALTEAVNRAAALHAPTIGGEALLLATAGGDRVHILCGDVATVASEATAATTEAADPDATVEDSE
jgi:hypothetical protein